MKLAAICFLLLFVTACATPMTTPPFGVASENAWFLEQDTSNQIARPVYCMSDVKEGKAYPKCYRSKSIP